jgi:hypothetical protein
MAANVETLLAVLKKMRFAGRVTRIGPEYGFIRMDDADLDLFMHRDIVGEVIPWETLRPGDRLRFNVKESATRPGMYVASRVSREEKTA